VLVGVGGLDVASAGADGHHQFDLVVQVLRQAGIGHGAGLAGVDDHQRVGRLQEKEGGLAPGEAHLLGVLFIVAPDAVDAVHRKTGTAAKDRDRDRCRRIENKVHDSLSS
jgi:hypothetical protein